MPFLDLYVLRVGRPHTYGPKEADASRSMTVGGLKSETRWPPCPCPHRRSPKTGPDALCPQIFSWQAERSFQSACDRPASVATLSDPLDRPTSTHQPSAGASVRPVEQGLQAQCRTEPRPLTASQTKTCPTDRGEQVVARPAEGSLASWAGRTGRKATFESFVERSRCRIFGRDPDAKKPGAYAQEPFGASEQRP
jgi:hypothetical protein